MGLSSGPHGKLVAYKNNPWSLCCWLVLHGGAREIGSRENFLQDLEPLPRLGVW